MNNLIYVIPDNMINKLLYYETGFEQLHPIPEVYKWMASQGYVYEKDWQVIANKSVGYYVKFPNDEIATLFVLRWAQ